MRQAVAQHEKGPAGLFLGDLMLNLRQDLRLPRRRIFLFLAVLVLDVR